METLKINGIKDAQSYLKIATTIGAHLKFEKYVKLETEQQQKILAITYARKVIRNCKNEKAFNPFAFKITEDGTIEVSKEVKFFVSGKVFKPGAEGQEGVFKDVSKNIKVNIPILKLCCTEINDDNISFELNAIVYKDKKSLFAKVDKKALKEFESYHLTVSDEEMEKLKKFENEDFWIKHFPTELEYASKNEEILADFVETLYRRKLTTLSSEKVVFMKKIYSAANNNFPLFQKLDEVSKVQILDAGYDRTLARKEDKKDLYLFSRSVFEVKEAKKLHETVILKSKAYILKDISKDGRNLYYQKEAVNEEYQRINPVSRVDLWNLLTSTRRPRDEFDDF